MESEEQSPLAGVYGRRIITTGQSGKEVISFDTRSPTSPNAPPTPSASLSSKRITSAAELRTLGGNRPLTGGKLVVLEKPKIAGGQQSPTRSASGDVVIERYHDKYGQPTEPDMVGGSYKPIDDVTSLDSDNFSMCSDIIRNMHIHGDHYVPISDEESVADHYV